MRNKGRTENAALLNGGRMPISKLRAFIGEPHPLQLMGLVAFPVEPARGGGQTLGVPPEVWRRINNLDAEVLLFSREGVPGLFMVRRGWDQRWLVRDREGCCGVYLDFRVAVRDVKRGKNKPFGETTLEFRKASVVIDKKCRFLYVIVVIVVTVNTSRLGETVTEQNADVAAQRQHDNLPITIQSLPRSFVVAHELGHAQDAHDRLLAAIQPALQPICDPKPSSQHADRVTKAIDDEWARFTGEGHASEGASGGYPNNDPEKRAREAAWREYDLAQQGLAPITVH
jgi:hypothetical protein